MRWAGQRVGAGDAPGAVQADDGARGTGFMHESFHQNDASQFTRKWFAWANTLFGEFIVKIADEKPHLLTKPV
jgi:meiotically up-regulated gene 157 (Mug157) protein